MSKIISRKKTYKNFCKYLLIEQFGKTFEERKQAWRKCEEIALKGNISIEELLEWRNGELKEKEYNSYHWINK